MKLAFVLRACLLVAFGPSLASAQLTWESQEVKLQAKPEAAKTVGFFIFTNRGKEKVTILEAKASCSCTLVQPEKKTYEPGESGWLEVQLVHGTRSGLQSNSVLVRTDAPGDKGTELVFTVDLPTWVEIEPPFALWKQGDAPGAKELQVRLLRPGLQVAKATVEGKAFRLATPSPGVLRLTPVSTDQPSRAAVHVQIRLPDGSFRESKAYAVVK